MTIPDSRASGDMRMKSSSRYIRSPPRLIYANDVVWQLTAEELKSEQERKATLMFTSIQEDFQSKLDELSQTRQEELGDLEEMRLNRFRISKSLSAATQTAADSPSSSRVLSPDAPPPDDTSAPPVHVHYLDEEDSSSEADEDDRDYEKFLPLEEAMRTASEILIPDEKEVRLRGDDGMDTHPLRKIISSDRDRSALTSLAESSIRYITHYCLPFMTSSTEIFPSNWGSV